MPYIYKYIDKRDGVVKYVGLIRSDNNFPRRFLQHKSDPWYAEGEWAVEYAEVGSICDAEALEGHFIAYYHTYDYFNKAKASWGELSFAPMVKWRRFEEVSDAYFNEWSVVNHWGLEPRINWAVNQIWDIHSQVRHLQDRCDGLHRMLENAQDEATKLKLNDVRDWIRSRFEVCYGLASITSIENPPLLRWQDAYDDFLEFLDVDECFLDIDDFISIVNKTTILPDSSKHKDGIWGKLLEKGKTE